MHGRLNFFKERITAFVATNMSGTDKKKDYGNRQKQKNPNVLKIFNNIHL